MAPHKHDQHVQCNTAALHPKKPPVSAINPPSLGSQHADELCGDGQRSNKDGYHDDEERALDAVVDCRVGRALDGHHRHEVGVAKALRPHAVQPPIHKKMRLEYPVTQVPLPPEACKRLCLQAHVTSFTSPHGRLAARVHSQQAFELAIGAFILMIGRRDPTIQAVGSNSVRGMCTPGGPWCRVRVHLACAASRTSPARCPGHLAWPPQCPPARRSPAHNNLPNIPDHTPCSSVPSSGLQHSAEPHKPQDCLQYSRHLSGLPD